MYIYIYIYIWISCFRLIETNHAVPGTRAFEPADSLAGKQRKQAGGQACERTSWPDGKMGRQAGKNKRRNVVFESIVVGEIIVRSLYKWNEGGQSGRRARHRSTAQER